MADIKISKEKIKCNKKRIKFLFNVIQAVSFSLFFVFATILVVAVGKYGISTSGVENEIKNRIQAMNKKAATYSSLVLNEEAYKDTVCENGLGGLSSIKRKYFNNKDSNYIFDFKTDFDAAVDNYNGQTVIGNASYKVTTKGKFDYLDEIDDHCNFTFNRKKLYNNAIEQFYCDNGYNKTEKEQVISLLKKIYPYDKMILDFYSLEGQIVCSVSFSDYSEKMIKKLKLPKIIIGGQNLDVADYSWQEAIFSTDSGGDSVSPFTGEFKTGILKICNEQELLNGNLKFAVHGFKEEKDRCNVYTKEYWMSTQRYKLTGTIRKQLNSGDDFYYLHWYREHVKSITFIVYISGILLIISSIGSAALARVSKNEKGQYRIFYRIPADIALLLIVAAVSIIVNVIINTENEEIKELIKYGFNNIITIAVAAGTVAGVFITIFYTSFCAQIKESIVVNNMLIIKLIRSVAKVIKSLFSMVKTSVAVFAVYWAAGIVECVLMIYSGSKAAFLIIIIAKILGTLILARVLSDLSRLHTGIKQMAAGAIEGKIKTDNMLIPVKSEAESLNCISDGMKKAVDAQIKSERMKTELITNVSHDLKTPVTAIISYVDLLKKEDLKNKEVAGYVDVLDRQSQRLKNLIYDLLDLSKASTGNVEVDMSEIDLSVFIEQSLGEYMSKMENRNLIPVVSFKADDEKKNEIKVWADGRHLSRVFDNILQNICKYAMENTRVYMDVEIFTENTGDDDISGMQNKVSISIKNISEQPLNISGDELTERFVRGDESRNTDGSGLGLSIAKSLMELQGGNLDVIIDGDLFKVVITLNGLANDQDENDDQ